MNFYLKAFVLLLILSLAAYGLHYSIEAIPVFSLIKLYSFLFIATLGSVSGMHYLFQIVPNQLGYAFLVTVFVKFGAAIILFPQLMSEQPSLSTTQILSFLIPYFLFLTVEAFMVIKWLNKTPLDSNSAE